MLYNNNKFCCKIVITLPSVVMNKNEKLNLAFSLSKYLHFYTEYNPLLSLKIIRQEKRKDINMLG